MISGIELFLWREWCWDVDKLFTFQSADLEQIAIFSGIAARVQTESFACNYYSLISTLLWDPLSDSLLDSLWKLLKILILISVSIN